MREYYRERAREYERIYEKPERQESLATLKARLRELFAGASVMELACGTGYWTSVLSGSARRIAATDVNEEVLALAREKDYGGCAVEFSLGDAYAPEASPGADAAFAGFWFSHVERERRALFVDSLCSALPHGSLVCLIDNLYSEGSSTPIARVDSGGNTFQERRLGDGRKFEVLKNFPTRDELEGVFAPRSSEFAYEDFGYFWLVSFRTRR